MTDRERKAIRHARIAVVCIYAASWIMAAGGIWAWAGETIGMVR